MRGSDTKLSDEDEKGYRGWLAKQGQVPGMGNLGKDWSHKSYDLRGVYHKYGAVDLKNANIPDEFKKSDLTQGPEETQENWAKKGGGDKLDSSNVAPWYSDSGSGLVEGMDAPWTKMTGNPSNIVRSA